MSRALEKEINAFVESLDAQLVRLIEAVVPNLEGLSRTDADRVMEHAIVGLWQRRERFDPLTMELPMFFKGLVATVVKVFRHHAGPLPYEIDDEGRAVLAALRGRPFIPPIPNPEDPKKTYSGYAPRGERKKVDPVQKIGKDCPPCWRCKYFYGWLPAQEYMPQQHADPEVAEACERIDRRKIAIANWVRSGKTWSEAELQQE